MLEALGMVVEERADGAAQRHDRHACRRIKPGNQPDQITHQNEYEHDGEKGCVGLNVVPDDFMTLPMHEAFDALERVLQPARRLHRKS